MTKQTDHTSTRPTHVMFVDGDEHYTKPVFGMSLKELNDKATEIIRANPDAKCGIYQLRLDLSGEIKINETHFNN